MRSAATSTRSPPRSTRATTRGCSTVTWSWRSTISPTCCSTPRSGRTTSRPRPGDPVRRSTCTTTRLRTSSTTCSPGRCGRGTRWAGPSWARANGSGRRRPDPFGGSIAALRPRPPRRRGGRQRPLRRPRSDADRTDGRRPRALGPGRSVVAAPRRAPAAEGFGRPATSSGRRPSRRTSCCGTNGLARTDPERFAFLIANTALGGGMSLATLPGDPREARARVHGVQLPLAVRGGRPVLGLRRHDAREGSRGRAIDARAGRGRSATATSSAEEFERAKGHVKGSTVLSPRGPRREDVAAREVGDRERRDPHGRRDPAPRARASPSRMPVGSPTGYCRNP